MIKVKNLTKTYYLGEEPVHVLKDISLEIKKKEYVGILGTSGSGKSTLMYIIGMLERPTSGTILIDNEDISKVSDEKLSKLRNEKIGFVFQSFNLVEKYTVLENILLPTRFAKFDMKYDPLKRAEELLQRFGIYERRDFYPNNISGGQQQRVAIARALIMNPEVVLADEPTGNLDTTTGDEILDLLEELNKELGVTIIVVTHEKEVSDRTKRQVYIKDGALVTKY